MILVRIKPVLLSRPWRVSQMPRTSTAGVFLPKEVCMKILSCYKVLQQDNLIAGGIGQGGGGYWQETVGIQLQQAIATELEAELILYQRTHGRDAFDGGDYDIPETTDIAYCQLFECPKQRPADFVWTMISDYVGKQYEDHLEIFLSRVKPNLIISLQYPLNPPAKIPTVPQLGQLPNLVEQCAAYGCRVVHLPWFNQRNILTYNPNKTLACMCTGKMSGTYPFRDTAWKFLQKLNRLDIVLSGNPTGSTFTLSDADYHRCLATTRYYVTGGIYDLQIPPKCFEVMNHGAALIINPMPMLEACGFIDGQTCIVAKNVDEIPAIIERDDWQRIAPAGQTMVHQRHSLETRAKEIAALYREMTGK